MYLADLSVFYAIKNPGITKSVMPGQGINSISCGATPLGDISHPLCAYYHMLTLDHGESAPSPILRMIRFCSPSEVHSLTRPMLQSHRLQLSLIG